MPDNGDLIMVERTYQRAGSPSLRTIEPIPAEGAVGQILNAEWVESVTVQAKDGATRIYRLHQGAGSDG